MTFSTYKKAVSTPARVPAGALLRIGLTSILLTLLLTQPQRSSAQGEIVILHTGGDTPLVSASMPLTIPDGGPGAIVSFNLGFATDELATPNTFLDAATAALSDGTSTLFLPLVTMDAFGSVWAPGGEGTVPLPLWAITRQLIEPPAGAPSLGSVTAWDVRVMVPEVLLEDDLVFYLDLFDNLDELQSAAWFGDLRVEVIPEPTAGGIIMLGLTCLYRFRGRNS